MLSSPPGASRGPIGWQPERGWGPVPQPGGQQADLFKERHLPGGGPGLALIRDGNGTRSFETLLRYRGAAMAEFSRALRTLKALQVEQAVAPGAALPAGLTRSAPPRPLAAGPRPSEPEQPTRRLQHVMPEPPPPGRALHEPAAPWLPDQPACRTNPSPQPLIGQTITADGAQPTTAALLQSMPGIGSALLELARAKPNEFDKAKQDSSLTSRPSAQSAAARAPSGPDRGDRRGPRCFA